MDWASSIADFDGELSQASENMQMGGFADELANAFAKILRPVDPNTGKVIPVTTVETTVDWTTIIKLGAGIVIGTAAGAKLAKMLP